MSEEPTNNSKKLILALALCLTICAGLAFLINQFSP